MQVLNKYDKEQLVIKLHGWRDIAQAVHVSFTDIGKIIRKINGQKDKMLDLENKSKDTQALYLFSIGKTPLEVKFELDIPTSDVYDLQEEFWALDQLHELAFVFSEIKNFLPSFMKLYRS